MRTLTFLAACALTGAVWADTTTSVIKVYSLDVKERVQNLELIDVTAEKKASSETAVDAELQAILDEAAIFEEEKSGLEDEQ